jgi:proline utilization trans-activator
MLNSIGRLQHLVEPRAVSDRISAAYTTSPPSFDRQDLWYVEILMVFALGQLLKGELSSITMLPGATWYTEAVCLLPEFATLRTAGPVAVEIMGLMAMYLQCADRREDAYLYVGSQLPIRLCNRR